MSYHSNSNCGVKMESEGRRNQRVWSESVSKCTYQGLDSSTKLNSNVQVSNRTIADVSVPGTSRHGFPEPDMNCSVSEMMGSEERKGVVEVLNRGSGECTNNLFNTTSSYGPVRKFNSTSRATPYSLSACDSGNNYITKSSYRHTNVKLLN
ncbi:hypothetical protein LOTGIDRAFT_175532 [Lottia gigantea]|uniref:Uncharacterized protein n=1 Tax=Lottia gigantea TaxID=225164 RepID=V4AKH9_LOTGI|nr:hypothetical protein LOTGIDRAFT_175532 [Lottia gigantea]ESO94061.1 hypothetical protein LOTGIDRAFT_175532 [Lottia gigantea]